MGKRIAIALAIAPLVALQCYLLYALQHGAGTHFEEVWRAFGVSRTGYSAFVFRTLQFWSLVPVLVLFLTGYSAWRRSRRAAALAIAAAVLGSVALLWALYAPALMVQL